MAKNKASGEKFRAKPYQVFISHATTDKWLAKVLCEKIEATGATTFRDDRDIQGGEHGQIVSDVVELRYRGRSVKGAVFVVAGHPDGCATVHLGYGPPLTAEALFATGRDARAATAVVVKHTRMLMQQVLPNDDVAAPVGPAWSSNLAIGQRG